MTLETDRDVITSGAGDVVPYGRLQAIEALILFYVLIYSRCNRQK